MPIGKDNSPEYVFRTLRLGPAVRRQSITFAASSSTIWPGVTPLTCRLRSTPIVLFAFVGCSVADPAQEYFPLEPHPFGPRDFENETPEIGESLGQVHLLLSSLLVPMLERRGAR